jgi:membrane protease YdiL (CAAX protease family)
MALLEYLLFLGFTTVLLMLRFDARRFGAADWDDQTELDGNTAKAWLRRGTWYLLAIALIVIAFRLYPQPVSQLHIQMGNDRFQAVTFGLALGALGTSVAFLVALFRYGDLQLPAGRFYPGVAFSSICTAFIDEVLFRGIILGLLLAYDWPPFLAVATQAILYGLVTRLGGPGRNLLQLAISIGMGLITGWLVLATGGIGAAVLGHAITRFAIFLATGHSGQARRAGWKRVQAGYVPPPVGWEYAGEGYLSAEPDEGYWPDDES